MKVNIVVGTMIINLHTGKMEWQGKHYNYCFSLSGKWATWIPYYYALTEGREDALIKVTKFLIDNGLTLAIE